MMKNALINAFTASGYIVLVVGVMTLISQTQQNKPDTFLAPIVFLSLLTLSVVVMSYIFFYQPIQLFVAGKKKQAFELFAQTAAAFAVITLVISIIAFTLG